MATKAESKALHARKRKFGGESYRLGEVVRTKEHARFGAKILREKGKKVRIVKAPPGRYIGDFRYECWVRD